MSEIEEFQQRIIAALDRIGGGVEAARSARAGLDARAEAELSEVKQALKDARQDKAQIEEQLGALRSRSADLERELEALQTSMADSLSRLDGDLQSLRTANQQLRDNNAALRQANASGLSEPDLINRAMQAELDGLRASYAADRAETDAILAQLSGVLDSSGAAPTQQENA